MFLEQMKWTELAGLAEKVVVVPLGSIEQHGPHLPLFTDSAIITEIACRVESARPGLAVITPTLWLGHSPHHTSFGCLSLDVRPYMDMVGGVCRSLVNMGARRILLLNGHGGNDVGVKGALAELKREFRGTDELFMVYATYWSLAADAVRKVRTSPLGGMGHACEMETSIMLALHRELVDMSKVEDAPVCDPSGKRKMDMQNPLPYYAVFNLDELSVAGTAGMPSHASSEKGGRFLDAIESAVVSFIDELSRWKMVQR